MEALRQSLLQNGGNSKPDYRRAQCSMNRLDRLESALWEAHGTEAKAATVCETQTMQVYTYL